MTAHLESLKDVLLAHWDVFEGLTNSNAARVKTLDGHNLDLATVLAVARYVSMLFPPAGCSIVVQVQWLRESIRKCAFGHHRKRQSTPSQH